jgi:subtilisin family serine protease
MQVDRAWDITHGDSSVIVAVLDTGVDWEHPDLQDNMWINTAEDINENGVFDNFGWPSGGDLDTLDNDDNGFVDDVIGWDFNCVPPYTDPYNPTHKVLPTGWNAHGTVMSSIISATTDNGFVPPDSLWGMSGIGFRTKIMALRCVQTSYPYSDIFDATQYAIDNGADIVNMSFTLPTTLGTWHELMQEAYDEKNVVFVTSAADDDTDIGTSGRYPNVWDDVVTTVSVVDTLKLKTVLCNGNKGSNWGDVVEICAPSSGACERPLGGLRACVKLRPEEPLVNYYPGDDAPHVFSRTTIVTSGGCAEVSGVMALLRAFHPDASADFLRAELRRGAMPLNPNEPYIDQLGAGVVNAYRSLTQWGTISQNTTWSDTVYVSGDVTVAGGATLTVSPGTTVYMMPDDNEHTGADHSRVELWVKGGILDVNGTSVSPVRFIAWGESGEISDSTAWWGIFVRDTLNSGASFDYCTVKNARMGLETQVGITVNHCTIENCAKRGISVAYADSVYIANTTIRDIGPGDQEDAFGLNVVAGSTVRIDYSTIENVGTNAAQVLSDSKLYANQTQFLGSDKGLYVFRDYGDSVGAVVYLCRFRHNDCGLWVKGQGVSDVSVRSSEIDSNTTANVYCENAASFGLEGNTIEYSPVGVLADASSPSITNGNHIQNNTTGIKFDNGSDGAIEGTMITDNQWGVLALDESEPDLGDGPWGSSGDNSIYTNSGYYVSSLSEEITIMARYNFWNVTQGACLPKANKFYGLVDYSAPLCSPPQVAEAETGVETAEVPSRYALDYNYPNPFNPRTTIRYAVPPPGGHISIVIYNVGGQVVTTLVDEEKSPQFYSIAWDGTNARGEPVATGVYFVRMRAPGFEMTKKVLLLK